MEKLRRFIESKRHSRKLYWILLIYLKDLLWNIKRNDSIFAYPLQFYYYLSLFARNKRRGKHKENIAAIVLSWKRTKNLPQIVFGLKKQSFIDDIFILHNHPSKLWVPGCKNIFFKKNKGCIIRHHFASTLKEYDYFVFSDDDLMLKDDFSKEVLEAIRKHGKESVLGFIGHELDLNNKDKPYTSGKYKTSKKVIMPVDIVKGRFHIISKLGITVMAKSGLDTDALKSEDDLRANIALQRKFKKPSYLIPIKHEIVELQDNHALEYRSFHIKYRDRAIRDGLTLGWKSIK
ncbi:hypothetical protein ACFL27_14325 [candidate division CSSED10-310 bacterium]|uniref:Glycosyltransferase family 2 protein n=1 Tax=candidate division CSSED10-310 bacterium TaxID=2855610 RepID=A0ABV6YYU3_UNCC1